MQILRRLNAPSGAQCFPTRTRRSCHFCGLPLSQCTFWCSVLSDPKKSPWNSVLGWSQCTFWCSVLSDTATENTPSSTTCRSQCTFWCSVLSDWNGPYVWLKINLASQCTFWCSVLSDQEHRRVFEFFQRVSMHLLVLSAFRQNLASPCGRRATSSSQCTFWCSVLSDRQMCGARSASTVSMHLLVLSAFRRSKE